MNVSWSNAKDLLAEWSETKNDYLGNSIFKFFESELRSMTAPKFRQPEYYDDWLSAFLKKMIQDSNKFLQADNLKAYLHSSLRNHMLTAIRKRKKQSLEVSFEYYTDRLKSTDNTFDNDRADSIQSALEKLKIKDQILIKLAHSPEWLNERDIEWIVKHKMLSRSILIEKIKTDDKNEIVNIWIRNNDDPEDKRLRRKRFETFRKAVSRSQDRLRPLLIQEGIHP